MQPPPRTTRSTVSPGLVDRPNSRCSSAVVTQEKAKRQQAAALKAEKLRHRTAQVNEVEREIRRAQAEVPPVRQRGEGKITKKTFPRPDKDVNVSSSDLCASGNFSPILTLPPIANNTDYNGQERQEECGFCRPI